MILPLVVTFFIKFEKNDQIPWYALCENIIYLSIM